MQDKEPGVFMTRIAKITELNQRLNDLLEHPEPGLITWLSAVGNTIRDMADTLDGKHDKGKRHDRSRLERQH